MLCTCVHVKQSCRKVYNTQSNCHMSAVMLCTTTCTVRYTQYRQLNVAHPCVTRAANKAEGELIKRKAAEEAAELEAKEAAWRRKALEMNAATKATQDTLLAFKAAEKERNRQLEAAVEGNGTELLVPVAVSATVVCFMVPA